MTSIILVGATFGPYNDKVRFYHHAAAIGLKEGAFRSILITAVLSSQSDFHYTSGQATFGPYNDKIRFYHHAAAIGLKEGAFQSGYYRCAV